MATKVGRAPGARLGPYARRGSLRSGCRTPLASRHRGHRSRPGRRDDVCYSAGGVPGVGRCGLCRGCDPAAGGMWVAAVNSGFCRDLICNPASVAPRRLGHAPARFTPIGSRLEIVPPFVVGCVSDDVAMSAAISACDRGSGDSGHCLKGSMGLDADCSGTARGRPRSAPLARGAVAGRL